MDIQYKTAVYQAAFSVAKFKDKLRQLGGKGTFELMERAFQLYFLAKSPHVPLWVKAVVVSALGYFIVVPDAVPDVTPLLGFIDDLSVMASALVAVAAHISPEIREKTKERLQGLKEHAEK